MDSAAISGRGANQDNDRRANRKEGNLTFESCNLAFTSYFGLFSSQVQDGGNDGGGARGHGVLRGEERDEHRQLDFQALLSVVRKMQRGYKYQTLGCVMVGRKGCVERSCDQRRDRALHATFLNDI